MNRPLYIPDDPEIAIVETVDALFSYERDRDEAMVLLPRPIKGSFNDLAIWLLRQNAYYDTRVHAGTHYIPVQYSLKQVDGFMTDHCMDWPDELGQIRDDMRLMEKNTGVSAELRVVRDSGYHPETYDFHQDNAARYKPVLKDTDRILCAYNDPVTECLLTANAVKVEGYVSDLNRFHKKFKAPTYHPGIGDIWRQTCVDGGRALIHRAVRIPAIYAAHPWKSQRPWNPPRLLVVC